MTSLVYDVVYASEFHQTDAMYSFLHVSNDQGRCQGAPPEGSQHSHVRYLLPLHTTHILTARVQNLQAVIVGVRDYNESVSIRGHSMHPYLLPTPWRSPSSDPLLFTGLQAERVQASLLKVRNEQQLPALVLHVAHVTDPPAGTGTDRPPRHHRPRTQYLVQPARAGTAILTDQRGGSQRQQTPRDPVHQGALFQYCAEITGIMERQGLPETNNKTQQLNCRTQISRLA